MICLHALPLTSFASSFILSAQSFPSPYDNEHEYAVSAKQANQYTNHSFEATLSVSEHLIIKSDMLLGKFRASFFPTRAERKPQTLQLFSVAVENKQMLFLNMSGMHHHKDTSIMFQCSVCVSVCWSRNALSKASPLLRVAADSLSQPLNLLPACVIHTHLPLRVPPQHLEPEARGGQLCFTNMSSYTRTRAGTVNN